MERTVLYSAAPWESSAGYSRAVRVGNHIFVSGTTAVDQHTRELLGVGDVKKQCEIIWHNISDVLLKAGAELSQVVRTRMFVVDIHKNGPLVAEIHKKYFEKITPASTMVGVAGLYLPEMLVEFEVDVIIPLPQ